MTTAAYIGGLNALGEKFVDDPVGGVPSVEMAYDVIGEIRTQTVPRKVGCLKIDGLDVQDILLDTINPLTIFVGKDSPLSFGSGWQVKSVSADNLSASMMTIAVTYERILQGVWSFGLPSLVTVSCTDGNVTLSYDGTPVQVWNTSEECQYAPLKFVGRAVTSAKYTVELFANGVKVQAWDLDITGGLDPQNNLTHRMHWESDGTTYARLVLLGTSLFDFSG